MHLAERSEPYRDREWNGRSDDLRPTLYLDDVSAIPFLIGVSAVEEYQHRARVRAGDGDLVASVTPPVAAYEAYCRDRLRLGQPESIVAEVVTEAIAVARACLEGHAFRRIVERSAPCGLTIHPYMSIEPVWELAARLREATGQPCQVIGPPPPIMWLANDKALFTEMVDAVLGPDWLVDTRITSDPEVLARYLQELAETHEIVALKRARCASGMGNQTFDARALAKKSPPEVEAGILAFLSRTEWDGQERVLAVGWEETTVTPSTQLWLPPKELGAPQLQGVYEQILSPGTSIFLGSRPSTLPDALNRRIGEASLALATGLQDLGYLGRCSFDLLLVGDPNGDCRVRFVECNGRWGGTSIPMRLVDRLMGETGTPRPPYRAQDFVHPDLVGVPFTEVLERVGDTAYDPARGRGRYIFYNVGPLPTSGKLDVIAIGKTQEDAEGALEEELPALLGLPG
ncbi:MAG TPA: hypothetical protein VGC53_05545 [Vicinamibacteria bacterium]